MISLIMVEYKCLEEINKQIDNILKFWELNDFEIIVVINTAYPENIRMNIIKDLNKTKFVKAIFVNKNVGFAKGVNIGIKNAKFNKLFILNPDCRFIKGEIKKFLEMYNEEEIYGFNFINDKNEEVESFRKFPTIKILIKRNLVRLKGSDGMVFDKEVNSNEIWIPGAAMLFSKYIIGKIGKFDERFFMYFEDVDFCLRAREAGIGIKINDNIIFSHEGKRKSTKNILFSFNNKLSYYHLISCLKYFNKNWNLLKGK